MSNSLRDQLLGLGFKPATPAPKKGPPAQTRKPHAKPPADKPRTNKPRVRTQDEIDLAKAYAIRAQREKQERIETERQKQAAARQRREAQAKLNAFLQGKSLNVAEADIARHFEYGGKIKRIYVTPEQLKALNAGELGVVQLNGRYLLVSAEVLDEAETIFAPAVALRVNPDAAPEDDPYADPRYQIPDDLIW